MNRVKKSEFYYWCSIIGILILFISCNSADSNNLNRKKNAITKGSWIMVAKSIHQTGLVDINEHFNIDESPLTLNFFNDGNLEVFFKGSASYSSWTWSYDKKDELIIIEGVMEGNYSIRELNDSNLILILNQINVFKEDSNIFWFRHDDNTDW